ncbi:inositol monophosphatase family protein, partial [Salinispira pacifica]
MAELEPTALLAAAQAAAARASAIHRELTETGFSVGSKSARHDRVTDADYRAEEAAVALIRERYPDHNFVAEENSYERTSSPYCWYIDPLDGTVNFSRGIAYYCVSIAVARGDELLAGVVSDSTSNETFAAVKGGGAFLNNRRIWTSRTADYQDAILISGFFYTDRQTTEQNLALLARFFEKRVVSIRRLGSAALDMCQVACGRGDAYWQSRLNPWDFAAGRLILEEAGGRVTDEHDRPVKLEPGYVVASNGPFHQRVLDT